MTDDTQNPGDRPRLGISSCLLGREVRHDGSHRRDRWLLDDVGPHVEWRPVCPELEAGFGLPRPAMRLSLDSHGETRLVRSEDGTDVTATLEAYATRRVPELATSALDGYIWKKGSPSCGLERVRVARPDGAQPIDGRGLFAAAVAHALPLLAMEEEGRLRDPRLREHFFTRVFAARRLRECFETDPSPRALVELHARHKYLLLAHDPQRAAELGRLVARAGADWDEVADAYPVSFAAALARPASVGRHVNVLEHLMGAIEGITTAERATLRSAIEEYRAGLVPLVVPVALVRQLLVEHDASREWASSQIYLDPYPRSLMLRNTI